MKAAGSLPSFLTASVFLFLRSHAVSLHFLNPLRRDGGLFYELAVPRHQLRLRRDPDPR